MESFHAYENDTSIAAFNFDYDEIDRHLLEEFDPATPETEGLKRDWKREGRSSASSDLLKQTLESLLPVALSGSTAQSLGLRCVCLLWMLQSERHDLGSRPLSEIAKQLKVSRAILSFHVRSLEELLGFFHARGQKAVQARESYKESVKAGWETRRAVHGGTGRKPALHPDKNLRRKAVRQAENLTHPPRNAPHDSHHDNQQYPENLAGN
ncbi:MAG: hypothetical protein K8R57_02965 [Verrucomicrobia bacterium]|nr:hypothetical protein [Verrucomicrobiota bacterium]